MSELIYDKMLNIKSIGIREWPKEEKQYNRYEATPYFALGKLFNQTKLNSNDKFVDYGCGLGRVAFYVNNRFGIDVTVALAVGFNTNKLQAHAYANESTYQNVKII